MSLCSSSPDITPAGHADETGLAGNTKSMKTFMHVLAVLCVFFTASCERPVISPDALEPKHALEGGWLANDGTVFLFRTDGTFHGYDFRKREIWGNWVSLSDVRIGFQSLLHDSFYNPQYAIIDIANKDRMDYIVTGGTHFIPAKRISTADAEAAIKVVVTQGIHHPQQAAPPSR
jgi:hypothetical protein